MKKYTSLTLLTLLVMLAGACSKDTPVESRAESANITVNIASRGQVDTNNEKVKANEGIKTLRLIMVQEDKVVLNSLHSYTDDLLNKSIRILGVNSTPLTDFYVVINEAGVEKNFQTDFAVGKTFVETDFNQASLRAIDIQRNGLPMAGKLTSQQLVDNSSYSIEVTRAVARIDLNINNQSGGNLTVNSINFGAFFPDKGGLVTDPSGITYSPQSFDPLSAPINAGKTQTFTYYLFASDAPDNTYTVGMTGSTNFEAKPIIDKSTNAQLTSIPRNTVLKIEATAKSNGLQLTSTVADWNDKAISIEWNGKAEFQIGWDEGTTNEVSINSPSKLKFTPGTTQMTNEVNWKASLGGAGLENFSLVHEGKEAESVGGVIKNNEPILLTIKVKDHTATYNNQNAELVFSVENSLGGFDAVAFPKDIAGFQPDKSTKLLIIRAK